jgi:hypothetical protein
LSKVIQATSKETLIRIQGHPLESLRLVQRGISERGPFVITDFRQVPLEECTPIEISYDLRTDEDYAKLVVKNEGEIIRASQTGDTVTFGWRPQNYAGDYELALVTFNRKGETLRSAQFVIRIIPWKVSEEDFYQLYNDLRERNLQIYNLISPATIEETKDRQNRSNLMEQAKMLEERIRDLENVVFLISQNPKKQVIHTLEQKLLHEAYGIDYHTLLDLAGSYERLIPTSNQRIAPQLQEILTHKRTHSPYLPEKVVSRKTEISYDVYENRVLKRFLLMLTELLSLYSKMVEQELQRKKSEETESDVGVQSLQNILAKAHHLRRRVSLLLNYPFLQDVGLAKELVHMTPTLEREVNYRRFYQLYQDFLWSPYFQTSDVFKLGIKDLPTIYEYWCTLFVCQSVLGLIDRNWGLRTQSILTTHRLGYELDIKKRGPLLVMQQGSKSITVYFKMPFTPESRPYRSYTHAQVPDITIEVKTENSRQLMILDPKYRHNLQFGEDPESAINKMHVYKDSIRDVDGNKAVSRAFVLYPGEVGKSLEESDKEFKVREEIIGAFALRPTPREEIDQRKETLLNIVTGLL